MNIVYDKIIKACKRLNINTTQYLICVSICEQKLYLFCENRILKTFDVSTSRAKPSCVEGSLGTPCGLHKIDGKIGADAPLETVFRGRIACGLVAEQSEDEREKNLITTRILRLRGLEEGVNSGGNIDTYARYVYIHGTNQEDKIGQPNSHGCVLLRNADVASLFDIVKDGTLVLISEDF